MMESTTFKLDVTNIPPGNKWEKDGACWMAVWDSHEKAGWRWRPQNIKAFEKDGPTGEMYDYIPVVGLPDFTKENQYEFECGGCGGHFLGHKGRCICDVCRLVEDED